MDYLDPAHKRTHTIKLVIGYILMAVVLAFVSLILWLQSYGYDVNRHTGQIIQNGLVYVDSHPVAADVVMNGQNKGKTSLKLVIPADTYNFKLKASGYRSWSNTVKLDGGSIVQLIYPFLFPAKLTTADQQLYASAPQLATQSPDRHWILVQPAGTVTHFDMYDVSSKDIPQTSFDLPAGLLTQDSGSLSVVEWSTDNRHVLLKHIFPGGNEFIMLDRDTPTSSININKALASGPTSISLRDKRYDRLYLYDAASQTVSTADLKTNQVKSLLTKVLFFKPYGANQVLYVSDDLANKAQYSVKLWDGNKNYIIHNYPAATDYLLEMANFSGSDYAVICVASKGSVYVYKDPLSQAKSAQTPSPFMLLKLTSPQFVSFSANTRFIAIQSRNHFAVYDIDQNKRYYFQIDDKFAVGSKATWMDGHRLSMVNGGSSYVFDFDGTNLQKLTPNSDGFTPFFNTNYSLLLNVAPSITVPNRFALTNTSLKAQP